jgi:hypothetical protein
MVGRPTPESDNAKRIMPPQPAKERKQPAEQQKQKGKQKGKPEKAGGG